MLTRGIRIILVAMQIHNRRARILRPHHGAIAHSARSGPGGLRTRAGASDRNLVCIPPKCAGVDTVAKREGCACTPVFAVSLLEPTRNIRCAACEPGGIQECPWA